MVRTTSAQADTVLCLCRLSKQPAQAAPLVGKHNVFAFKYSSKSKIKMNVRSRSDQCIKSLNKLLSLIFATAQRREAKCAVAESVQATGRRQS